MEDKAQAPVDNGQEVGGAFAQQLDRLRDFRDRMQSAGAAPRPEQFAVRTLEPVIRKNLSLTRSN